MGTVAIIFLIIFVVLFWTSYEPPESETQLPFSNLFLAVIQ